MIDLIQVQADVFGLLMSSPELANVNIVLERKFIVDQTVEMDAVWQTPRNGKSGCGVLVEEPDISTRDSNVSGPPQVVDLSFVCFQNGDAAFTPGYGSGLFAAEVEQHVLDALHLQSFGRLGTIQAEGKHSSPARDYPGINARRLTLKVKPLATRQTPRTAGPQASVDAGVCTLTTATAGADIWFTTDGTFPADSRTALDPISNEAVNAASSLYLAPFAVSSGQIIRAAAYKTGFNPGEVLYYTVP